MLLSEPEAWMVLARAVEARDDYNDAQRANASKTDGTLEALEALRRAASIVSNDSNSVGTLDALGLAPDPSLPVYTATLRALASRAAHPSSTYWNRPRAEMNC